MNLNVKVRTNSKNDKVSFEDGVYYVETKSSPTEGKANEAVISLLAEYLDVPKASLNIKYGKTSKSKVIEIKN